MVRTLRKGKIDSPLLIPNIPILTSNEEREVTEEDTEIIDSTHIESLQETLIGQTTTFENIDKSVLTSSVIDNGENHLLGSDLEMRVVYDGQVDCTATTSKTASSTVLSPSSLNVISFSSAVENVMHDHNLAKNVDKQSNKNIQSQGTTICPQTVQDQNSSSPSGTRLQTPLQNIIFTSLDGKTLTIDPGCQFIQMMPNINGASNTSNNSNITISNQLASPSMPSNNSSMAPFVLPPGYQLLNIPSLPSMPSSGVMIEKSIQENITTQLQENVYNGHEIHLVSDYSSAEVFHTKKRNRAPKTNPVLTVQIAEGESVTLQRFYYQAGMCRVCLLAKDNTTSIFEDVSIDDNGMIENSRGPYPVRYHIIPAIKTLLDVEVVYGDGLPDQICMDCFDSLVAFSAFRKKVDLGQTKFNEIISQVQGSMNPTFLPPLGESDFAKTGIFKHHGSIKLAKELLSNSQFSHMVKRSIPDRIWDKIFMAMSFMVGYKSGKLKSIEPYAYSPPFVSGWFCYTCNITIHDTKEGYARHFQDSHEITSTEELRYPCDICGGAFPICDSSGLSQDYGEHWIQHFFFHKCNVCSKKMPSSKGLWVHKKSAHTVVLDKAHHCNVCNKSFSKKAHLEAHAKTHLHPDERKHHLNYCDICGKGLTGSVSQHISTVHKDDRPWKCEICEKTFKRKEILSAHRETVHHNIKKYQCEVCGEFLKSHATKAVHLLRHKGERPHCCDVCGKRFYSLHSLKSHKVKHKDSRDFRCTECGKMFKRKMYLAEHMRIHSGEKPHECHICGRFIRMKSNYFKHMKIHKRRNEGVTKIMEQPLEENAEEIV